MDEAKRQGHRRSGLGGVLLSGRKYLVCPAAGSKWCDAFRHGDPSQRTEVKITGTIAATLSYFKIEPPTLLTVAVKNEMPVQVEMLWQAAP